MIGSIQDETKLFDIQIRIFFDPGKIVAITLGCWIVTGPVGFVIGDAVNLGRRVCVGSCERETEFFSG